MGREGADTATFLEWIEQLNRIGVGLSAEKDTPHLLEMILHGAKEMANADGGTLYSMTDDDRLRFEIVRNDSLGIAMGGGSGSEVTIPPISLYDEAGNPRLNMVVTSAVLREEIINIADAYVSTDFDFSGTYAFDAQTGYRSRSLLAVPMKDHEGRIIGVLQLINALDPLTKEVIPFSKEIVSLVASLASQASVAITQKRLIESLKNLFEALTQLIARAIDQKSPYTGGHCRRVPVLTMMLAEAAIAANDGPLGAFRLNEQESYELEIAAWLHDCGKITTPEYINDKATKLETVFDRIELIEARFEVLRRDARIDFLEKKSAALEAGREEELPRLESEYRETLQDLDDDLLFIRKSNTGSDFMGDSCKERIRQISGRYVWRDADDNDRLILTEDEITNLCIARGTLNDEERAKINHHIVATIEMLESLPLPPHLVNIPRYAGGHHEKLDGTGYPNRLSGSEVPVQARIMAIADIFEALTASDRPYKAAKTLSEAIRIMEFMAKDRHIDPDLFRLFIQSGIPARYAEKYLPPRQNDLAPRSEGSRQTPPSA